jgi:hypothetical protein
MNFLRYTIRQVCITVILLCVFAVFIDCTPLSMLRMLSTGTPGFIGSPSEISFELSGHKILLPVRINGCKKEYTFILDTCGPTVIDIGVSSELDIEKGRLLRLNNESKAYFSKKNVDVKLGDMQVNDLQVLIIDLGIFTESAGRSIHGFIGSGFLRHFSVTFDYHRKSIILGKSTNTETGSSVGHDPRSRTEFNVDLHAEIAQPVSKEYKFPITKSFPMNWPTIQCHFDDGIVSQALLDTGSPYAIVAPISLLEKQNFTEERTCLESAGVIVKWPSAFADSIDKNYMARFDSFQIGDLEILNLPVIYSNSGAILLGKRFLSQFIMTIDYPSEVLTLIPYPDMHFKQNIFSTGLGLRKDKQGRTLVNGYWKGSAADRHGLLPGDEVLAINSVETCDLTYKQISALLNDDSISDFDLVINTGDLERRVRLEKEFLFPEIVK